MSEPNFLDSLIQQTAQETNSAKMSEIEKEKEVLTQSEQRIDRYNKAKDRLKKAISKLKSQEYFDTERPEKIQEALEILEQEYDEKTEPLQNQIREKEEEILAKKLEIEESKKKLKQTISTKLKDSLTVEISDEEFNQKIEGIFELSLHQAIPNLSDDESQIAELEEELEELNNSLQEIKDEYNDRRDYKNRKSNPEVKEQLTDIQSKLEQRVQEAETELLKTEEGKEYLINVQVEEISKKINLNQSPSDFEIFGIPNTNINDFLEKFGSESLSQLRSGVEEQLETFLLQKYLNDIKTFIDNNVIYNGDKLDFNLKDLSAVDKDTFIDQISVLVLKEASVNSQDEYTQKAKNDDFIIYTDLKFIQRKALQKLSAYYKENPNNQLFEEINKKKNAILQKWDEAIESNLSFFNDQQKNQKIAELDQQLSEFNQQHRDTIDEALRLSSLAKNNQNAASHHQNLQYELNTTFGNSDQVVRISNQDGSLSVEFPQLQQMINAVTETIKEAKINLNKLEGVSNIINPDQYYQLLETKENELASKQLELSQKGFISLGKGKLNEEISALQTLIDNIKKYNFVEDTKRQEQLYSVRNSTQTLIKEVVNRYSNIYYKHLDNSRSKEIEIRNLYQEVAPTIREITSYQIPEEVQQLIDQKEEMLSDLQKLRNS